MSDLGSFGVAHEVDPDVGEDSFEFFGTRVRVNPEFGELDLADFFEAASLVNASDVGQSLALLKRTFRSCVHVDDFDEFWATAKRNRQGVTDLMHIVRAVITVVTARPTERPSDSSDGPSPTSEPSAVDSPSQVIADLESKGRPDLALIVTQAQALRRSA